MEEGVKFFVRLDVHKDRIVVATAEPGCTPARLIGSIAHDVGKLLLRYGDPRHVHVVNEPGLTDYGLQRSLAAGGFRCEVIARR